MSLLEPPTAQTLLADAEVSAADVRGCRRGLERFLRRYLPRFDRAAQRELARVVLQGKLSNRQRKTSEPIAFLANRERKPGQHFVGAGARDDESVRAEWRGHVAETMADPNAVPVLDPSGFAKKGDASCGVARQWCGRPGQVENCQVGVFLAYVTARGYAPWDRQWCLPEKGAEDAERRQETHVPETVAFQERWRRGLELLDRSGPDVPFGWVAGDDEWGRASAFRAALRERGLRDVLDVPSNTSIRDLGETPAPGRRLPPWRRLDEGAQGPPSSRWRRLVVGDGAKGPRVVRALETWVQAKGQNGCVGPVERLVVIRTAAEESQVWYTLSHASDVALPGVVQAHGRRHGIEESRQAGKGEVRPGHYEMRSWVGWRHHGTLSFLALGFLILEKDRRGEIPARTVPQRREVFARWLQRAPPSAARIAEEVSRVLRRNEEARIYHWYSATGEFPPRRGQPDG